MNRCNSSGLGGFASNPSKDNIVLCLVFDWTAVWSLQSDHGSTGTAQNHRKCPGWNFGCCMQGQLICKREIICLLCRGIHPTCFSAGITLTSCDSTSCHEGAFMGKLHHLQRKSSSPAGDLIWKSYSSPLSLSHSFILTSKRGSIRMFQCC